MIKGLTTTAKQTGLELIDMSDTLADSMRTWAELAAEDPDIAIATFTAGFISDPSEEHSLALTIDVQAPPDKAPVLRTWAIETVTNDDGAESFNNIQLTFETDGHQVHELVTKSNAITRGDIHQLLRSPSTQLANITVSNESGGDGTQQTHGERYDFRVDELANDSDKAAEVNNTLQVVLEKLKQALAKDLN